MSQVFSFISAKKSKRWSENQMDKKMLIWQTWDRKDNAKYENPIPSWMATRKPQAKLGRESSRIL